MTLKGQINVIEFSAGCFSLTKHAMNKVYQKHILEVIYELSVYLMTFVAGTGEECQEQTPEFMYNIAFITLIFAGTYYKALCMQPITAIYTTH